MADSAGVPPGGTHRHTVGVFVFDEVEVLDFAGPFEVFSRARLEGGVASRRDEATAPFEVFTIAATAGPIHATGGLVVTPRYHFGDAPPIDILVIPGGFGTRPLLESKPVVTWVERAGADARLVTSVCTGSLLLAKAGLLEGRRATTHWGALDTLAALDPSVTVERGQRVVDDTVVTSAGVSAGLDMAFTVVERFCGREVAEETANYIEYPWRAAGVTAPSAQG